ncbi:hypothetical protein [Bacillus nitratireducens]|uniref:hypothetical protein n=1 Tax=Bacillus nitratireducens TaxID=2026193 RepID=UPI000BEBE939|nr:hypothetical protein [Bacillus nitratireducens]PEA24250.1 hypothetical protein CON44_26810 [Bacillus cereus]PEQ33590.1 hypothetical protein CN467_21725 [Bacillus cereus]PER22141.1 hypothetical protein CN485_24660 [Bacillus cereus]PEY83650.1 hypothetical protein CN349_31350 [Bacillus cereus]PFK10306.1 hypothetical protein COJ05_28975 [Bacillus cereus]
MIGAISRKSERINLRRNKSWIYLAIISFLFLGFFAFLTSKIYMPNDEKLFHTETNKVIKLSGMGKLIVEKREYNPHKNFMEIRFRIEGYEETGFTFKAQEKGKPGVQLPVKVLYEENGNYVIEVKELSPNWGALALDIYNKNSEKEQMDIRKFTQDVNEYEEEITSTKSPNKLVQTIFTDQRKTKANDELLAEDKKTYELDFIERDKKDIETKIENYGKAIKLEEENGKTVYEKVKELKDEMKYQTEAEKTETQSKISSLESKIKSSEKNVELFKGEQKIARDKIKKLEQKAQEINKN